MRYGCFLCQKSVTSELPEDTVIRAILICPECIEAEKIIFLGAETNAATARTHFIGPKGSL